MEIKKKKLKKRPDQSWPLSLSNGPVRGVNRSNEKLYLIFLLLHVVYLEILYSLHTQV